MFHYPFPLLFQDLSPPDPVDDELVPDEPNERDESRDVLNEENEQLGADPSDHSDSEDSELDYRAIFSSDEELNSNKSSDGSDSERESDD